MANDYLDDFANTPILQRSPYIVYVKTNSSGYITAVNSSEFLPDTTGWTHIDSGFGDRYHHAQGNYFHHPVTDDRGIYRFKLVDGAAVERTQEEMDADYVPPDETPTLESRVKSVETQTGELAEALDLLLSGVTE